MQLRCRHVQSVIENTLTRNPEAVYHAVLTVEEWIRERAEIRIAGYGRARLAVGIPGNRLAHAGVHVSTLGDIAPLASTSRGGGLIAASSSGTTAHMLELLATCRRRAPQIVILGLANASALQFASMSDIFIGISTSSTHLEPTLLFFNDAVEYAISEVMDGVVAAAVERAGVTEQDLRRGHEDLGGTGPYTVRLEGPW